MTTDQPSTAVPTAAGRPHATTGGTTGGTIGAGSAAGTGATAAPPAARAPYSRLDRLFTALTRHPFSLYGAATLRIGYGLCYLAFLLREFPHREEIWGPDAPWTPALARALFRETGWFSFLTLSDGRAYFNVCYVFALAVCALFLLGWRTRLTSVLFAVVVAAFHARAVFMTDGGDNLLLLMSIYLTGTACGRRWSLDARRKARRARTGAADRWALSRASSDLWCRLAEVRTSLVTTAHNCAMFVIAAQVCLLYGSAGLYKVQGGTWQNGTALHYVVNLDLFRPWPALSTLVDGYPLFIAVSSYLAVLIQVAFPFALFSRLKYVLLALLLGMHLGIAVLMGLPVFSGAMIIADAAFIPDRFYRAAADGCRRAAGRLRRRPLAPRAAVVPAQPREAEPVR
ncbi:HTTM domain-containing protein [Actinacidiphila sp. ITFR-21]|uniref:HTTM domain-containing protein n=1 Tax=Actinacidiphila sp. ITFR-21 TaxID=3075199 RepID=UPI00288C2B87|nr:HTTM domain-containing protein [Streptomyces sp. ITFR-21]WNI16110.1 HTTM domain-containing protein [Streptomyces sp. ITFR-21]